ncbi:MAG: elongation factor P [Candidatus Zixiibacteriota bacterium]
MIEASELRNSSKFMYNGEPYEVIDFQKYIMGRGRGNIRVKMKQMKTGKVFENTFSTDEKFDYVDLRSASMQFLYFDGDAYIFMDQSTYEQHRFFEEQMGDAKWFLKDSEIYKILLIDDEPVSIDLPASMPLEIEQTEPAIKGDSVTNIYKDAVTATGLEVKVPLFISEGESILVDTRTLEYQKRYNG